MRRYTNLFEKVITIDNLRLAFQKAARGKRWRRQVRVVEDDLDNKLQELQQQLIDGTFRTSTYKLKKVYEPKERIIYVLPFYPDRIVQHALMNIIAPIWDKMFLSDSYACRPDKGQHRASKRVMEFIGGKEDLYCLQGDISKFFPSIHHKTMMQIVEHKIKDKRVLELIREIIQSIEGERNVPIGNLLSQWLGNLYMNEFDTWIKQVKRKPLYIRYCDDFIIMDKDKNVLQELKAELAVFLKENLKLSLSRCNIYPVNQGIDFVGYRHFPSRYVLVRKRTVKRMKRHLKKLDINKPEHSEAVICSISGWLRKANTYNLRRYLNERYTTGFKHSI